VTPALFGRSPLRSLDQASCLREGLGERTSTRGGQREGRGQEEDEGEKESEKQLQWTSDPLALRDERRTFEVGHAAAPTQGYCNCPSGEPKADRVPSSLQRKRQRLEGKFARMPFRTCDEGL